MAVTTTVGLAVPGVEVGLEMGTCMAAGLPGMRIATEGGGVGHDGVRLHVDSSAPATRLRP